MEKVILVDKHDQALGEMEKMEAHEKGLLHRAFSVFLFNERNELLLQKRAKSKYHSGGLWTNTCCSHPRSGETVLEAGHRRLQEELGISADLISQFSFIYKATLDNDLIEHELDHILIGKYEADPTPNPEEVEDWKYISIKAIEEDLNLNSDHYTIWFKVVFDRVKDALSKLNREQS